MCIRDRVLADADLDRAAEGAVRAAFSNGGQLCVSTERLYVCLLYTSDAADERSSGDLGGRRIIKKKNN